jgi:ureidoglycolate lyase
MRSIVPEALTREAFAPFGEIIEPLAEPGRVFHDKGLVNLRPIAGRPSLSLARIPPATARPVPLAKVERHPYSNQVFLPLASGFQYLVGVLPTAADGDAPDFAGLRVFVAEARQAINYRPNVWHLPMTVIGDTGHFAIVMFNDGTAADTEFRDIPEAMAVAVS